MLIVLEGGELKIEVSSSKMFALDASTMASKARAVIKKFAIAAILAAADASASPACEPSSADGIWQSINGHSILAEARLFSDESRSLSNARKDLGQPDKVSQESHGLTAMYWTRGTWRQSRSVDCKGNVADTYTVAYAILKLSFKDDKQVGCRVLERSFVSSARRPNPFHETRGLMLSSLQSCRDFLAAQDRRE